MSLQGFYTTKGLTLAAKIAAGTKLTITKVTAGSGVTVKDAPALAGEKQTLTAGTAAVSGATAVLPVTLAEAGVSAAYELTELGVYAQDPDAGEILFQVFRMDTPVPLTAGGENTYRFYLKQTVGAAGITVTCSPAGLLIDEDLAPIREKVMAVSAPERTVTLAAAEVSAYIAALPRMLVHDIQLKITAGTVASTLYFSGFYGPGRLRLTPAGDGVEVILAGGISAFHCKTEIQISGMTITGGDNYLKAAVGAHASTVITLNNCTLTAGSGITYGVAAVQGSQIYMIGGSLTGFKTAVLAEHTSIVSLCDIAASGSTVGAQTWAGGIVLLGGSTPETLGGSTNTKDGGMIVKKNGTPL